MYVYCIELYIYIYIYIYIEYTVVIYSMGPYVHKSYPI